MAAFNDFLMLSQLNRYVTRIVCVSMLYALPVSKEDYGRTKREKASYVGFLDCSNMFIFAGKYRTFVVNIRFMWAFQKSNRSIPPSF